MKDQDVTSVTRNDRYAELKVVADLLIWAASMYIMFHPETVDNLVGKAQGSWQKVVHRISIWTATQDIRSLPETDEQ